MNRITVAAVLGLIAAVPAGAAGVYFGSAPDIAPCLATPTGAFRISDKTADYTVRIDDAATAPSLRLQIVADPTVADFVLVDDGASCPSGAQIKSVRIDPTATTPDITIALTHAPADKKIYVKSARFSEQDGAALFAAVLKAGTRALAARTVTR